MESCLHCFTSSRLLSRTEHTVHLMLCRQAPSGATLPPSCTAWLRHPASASSMFSLLLEDSQVRAPAHSEAFAVLTAAWPWTQLAC